MDVRKLCYLPSLGNPNAYLQWQIEFAEPGSRMARSAAPSASATASGVPSDDMQSWTLDEIYEWANRCPRMKRWMQVTWWSPVPWAPIRPTDNLTFTMAYTSIGDVTYSIMFCLEIQMIRTMGAADLYWRSFGRYCIRDIGRHGHSWTPPEDYF